MDEDAALDPAVAAARQRRRAKKKAAEASAADSSVQTGHLWPARSVGPPRKCKKREERLVGKDLRCRKQCLFSLS